MSDDIPTVELFGKQWHIEEFGIDNELRRVPSSGPGAKCEPTGLRTTTIRLSEVGGEARIYADIDFDQADDELRAVTDPLIDAIANAEVDDE